MATAGEASPGRAQSAVGDGRAGGRPSMRILLIGINYWPEETGIAPYTTGLAEHLAARGHEITVLTGVPHYPQWRILESYAGRLRARESIRGVRVRRFRHYVPG
ncbi:MAG: glycosyltransferase, partial [Dehalococcoidia bacterium]